MDRDAGKYWYRGPASRNQWTVVEVDEDGIWIIGSEENLALGKAEPEEWGPQLYSPREAEEFERDVEFHHHSPRYHANVVLGSLMSRQQGLLTDLADLVTARIAQAVADEREYIARFLHICGANLHVHAERIDDLQDVLRAAKLRLGNLGHLRNDTTIELLKIAAAIDDLVEMVHAQEHHNPDLLRRLYDAVAPRKP